MRPRLQDPEADGALERDGFVVLRGEARNAVGLLRGVHRATLGSVPEGFHATLHSPDPELKHQVHRELLEALEPMLDRWFTGHRPLLASFVTKGRGGDGLMPPHQDWTFVDETQHSSLNVWIPLVRVDSRNGAMSVLPRGHRVPFTIRGTDTVNAFRALDPDVARDMVEVPMAAGDVLVHDHRVLHSSPPNTRRRPRIVVGCALLPEHVDAVHYRRVGPGSLQKFAVEQRFFTEHTYGCSDFPPSASRQADVVFEQPALTRSDLPSARPTDHSVDRLGRRFRTP